jgi:polyhydroxybutyrate depolymerase
VANLDGIGPASMMTDITHHALFKKTLAKKFVWGSTGGYQVELILIENGGHVEPSISQKVRPAYELIVGKQNHDFECAEEAWSFFRDKRAAPKR